MITTNSKEFEALLAIGKKYSGKSTTTSNYGTRWDYTERIRRCGSKIGEYLDSKGYIRPQFFFCGQYQDCDKCRAYRSQKLTDEAITAIHQAKQSRPDLEVHKAIILDNGEGKELDTFVKRIRRADGVYKRYPVEDGVYEVVSMIPADKAEDSKFGALIEPKLEYEDTQPYETYADTLGIDFDEVATYCKQADKKVTGNLKPNKQNSDNEYLLRYEVIIPKNAEHAKLKSEIDRDLQNPRYVNEYTDSIPIHKVNDNTELQIALDNMNKVYRRKYLDSGLDFSTISKFITVPADEYQKFNAQADLNRRVMNLNVDKMDFVRIRGSVVLKQQQNGQFGQNEIKPRLEPVYVNGQVSFIETYAQGTLFNMDKKEAAVSYYAE